MADWYDAAKMAVAAVLATGGSPQDAGAAAAAAIFIMAHGECNEVGVKRSYDVMCAEWRQEALAAEMRTWLTQHGLSNHCADALEFSDYSRFRELIGLPFLRAEDAENLGIGAADESRLLAAAATLNTAWHDDIRAREKSAPDIDDDEYDEYLEEEVRTWLAPHGLGDWAEMLVEDHWSDRLLRDLPFL